MFVDRIKVVAKAGNGGRGCVSFRREKFVPRGGPDGGDGGRGGDIILRADEHTDNLASLFYEPLIKAKNGTHGMGKQMHGKGASPKIVKVPAGTVVWEMLEGESVNSTNAPGLPNHSTAEPLADLVRPNDEYILCQGGKGGKGNVHFKSSRNRAPRQYSDGEEGEEGTFILELRTIADAGLVGYPNAGKSTLLRRLSAAHPKVAPYPFTTLHPMIGVVDFPDYLRATIADNPFTTLHPQLGVFDVDGREFVLADLPGLIEGAHENLGLGHAFLRHITRCRLLLFVVDMAGSEGRNPSEDLQHLRREIDLYDARLSQRPWRVIANKMDLPEAEENLIAFRRRFPNREVVEISAKERQGIDELKRELERWLRPGESGESLSTESFYAGAVEHGRRELLIDKP